MFIKKIKIVCVVIFMLGVGLGIVLWGKKNESLLFDTQELYCICYGENLNGDMLVNTQKQIERLGGAGVVMNDKIAGETVVVFAYTSFSDAEKILGVIKKQLPSAFLVERYTKKIGGRIKNTIENNEGLNNVITKLYKYSKSCFDMWEDYENGIVLASSMYRFMIETNYELNNMLSLIDDTKLREIYTSIKVVTVSIDTYLNRYITGSDAHLYLKKAVVSLLIEKMNIYDMISTF